MAPHIHQKPCALLACVCLCVSSSARDKNECLPAAARRQIAIIYSFYFLLYEHQVKLKVNCAVVCLCVLIVYNNRALTVIIFTTIFSCSTDFKFSRFLVQNSVTLKYNSHKQSIRTFGKRLAPFYLLNNMSTTTCNVRGKPSDGGLMQKVGPMKATIPMSSLLRPLNGSNNSVAGNVRTTLAGPANNLILYSAMSPPMRLISPDHNSSGHRSPGAANYFKGSHSTYDNR